MKPTRRKFIAKGAVGFGTAALFGSASSTSIGQNIFETPDIFEDPISRSLLEDALQSAKESGASYSDIRLVHIRNRNATPSTVNDNEGVTVGIRSLVDGYWGFAAGPAVRDADSMRRLGRESAFQAKQNTLGQVRHTVLADNSVVKNGHWTMPIKLDPFRDVHPDEVRDYLRSLELFLGTIHGVVRPAIGANTCAFNMKSVIFASTEGSYVTQKLYSTSGRFEFSVEFPQQKGGDGALESLTPAGMGWELYRGQPLRSQLEELVEEIRQDSTLPISPVDVGRYPIVFDSISAAKLINGTLGLSTQLDRILGFEANAGGTSYLNDPMEVAGNFQIAPALLSLTANRSSPGSVATVKWDDEGCVPQEFAIVQNGIINDFQTTREGVGVLSDYYRRIGKDIRSNGCAHSPDGIDSPLIHNANLVLQHGVDNQNFDTMLGTMDKGIAWRNVRFNMDFQQLSGLAIGKAYEIRKGKKTSLLKNAGALFNTLELWKNLKMVGGVDSAKRYGMVAVKGEPPQTSYSSVTSTPLLIGDTPVVDYKRKS